MDNVLQFPAKKIDKYQELKKLFGNGKFISFYINDEGSLSYLWGTDLTIEESTYILKVFDALVSDSLHENIEWKSDN